MELGFFSIKNSKVLYRSWYLRLVLFPNLRPHCEIQFFSEVICRKLQTEILGKKFSFVCGPYIFYTLHNTNWIKRNLFQRHVSGRANRNGITLPLSLEHLDRKPVRIMKKNISAVWQASTRTRRNFALYMCKQYVIQYNYLHVSFFHSMWR